MEKNENTGKERITMKIRLPYGSRRSGACRGSTGKAPVRRGQHRLWLLGAGAAACATVAAATIALTSPALSSAAARAADGSEPTTQVASGPSYSAAASEPTVAASPSTSSLSRQNRPSAATNAQARPSAATNAQARPSAARKQPIQLSATQLPAAAAEQWTPIGEPNTRTITGHDIRENECALVHGARTWSQQGFSGDSGQTAAVQDTFTFGRRSEAQTAYQGVATAMAHCQATTRSLQSANHTPPNAVVRQTAKLASSIAWERTWTGVMGISAEGPQTNHLYLAVSGAVLIVLQFTEFPGHAAPYDVARDPQVLAMLDAEPTR